MLLLVWEEVLLEHEVQELVAKPEDAAEAFPSIFLNFDSLMPKGIILMSATD